jgi:transglutaminase-like putative cysteine protease
MAAVPEAVKNKAWVVMHQENINVEVESLDKAKLKVHQVYTVVNEEGKKDLFFNEYTTKAMSLEDAEIRVYDANGRQLGKYKKKDMRTEAAGEGLIEDGAITYFMIPSSAYPLTVDLQYEKKLKSTLSLPDYRFIEPGEGVVESSYSIKIPPDIGLRYKARNTSIEPVITDDGKDKVYTWSVKNLSPIDYEEGAAAIQVRYPHIELRTDKFTYFGSEGDLSSWKNFGAWINALYQGLDVLPEDRKQFFVALVKDAANEKEKMKRIYNYLQQNFRYVSIQLGIGGLKPFSAEFTDKKKYGDCKALSNFMKSALSAVGIKSYVAIINAEYNQEPVDPSFPANDFNHVILCVPGPKDSIWLECTSSTTEFGELGSFTENRNALLVTEDGGFLVPTPKSQPESNRLTTRTTVSIADDLSAQSETIFTTKGEYREIMDDILKEKRDDQKEDLVFYYGFKQPDDFELARVPSTGGYQSTLTMTIRKVPEFTAGNKLFISPRMYKIWPKALPKAENRKLDFYFHFPFEKVDTTVFKLPAGAKPDALPAENELKCAYASFKSKFWYDEHDNSVYSVASLTLKQYKIPAADYASVKKFFDDLMQSDSQKFVIKKEEGEKKGF